MFAAMLGSIVGPMLATLPAPAVRFYNVTVII